MPYFIFSEIRFEFLPLSSNKMSSFFNYYQLFKVSLIKEFIVLVLAHIQFKGFLALHNQFMSIFIGVFIDLCFVGVYPMYMGYVGEEDFKLFV